MPRQALTPVLSQFVLRPHALWVHQVLLIVMALPPAFYLSRYIAVQTCDFFLKWPVILLQHITPLSPIEPSLLDTSPPSKVLLPHHLMGKSQYSSHRMSHNHSVSCHLFTPSIPSPWWYCVLGDTGSSHLTCCVKKRRRSGECWRNLNCFRIQLNQRAADWLSSSSVPIRQVVTISDLRARATRGAQERAHKFLSFLCSGARSHG